LGKKDGLGELDIVLTLLEHAHNVGKGELGCFLLDFVENVGGSHGKLRVIDLAIDLEFDSDDLSEELSSGALGLESGGEVLRNHLLIDLSLVLDLEGDGNLVLLHGSHILVEGEADVFKDGIGGVHNLASVLEGPVSVVDELDLSED